MSDDVLELLETAPAPPMSIDAHAVMQGGRRQLIRRRAGFIGAGAAAAAVVIAVATQVGAGTPRASEPAGTQSVSQQTTPVAAPRAVFDTDAGRYAVEIDATGTDPELRYLRPDNNGNVTQLSSEDASRVGSTAQVGFGLDGVVLLGVAPTGGESVSAFFLVGGRPVVPSRSELQHLAGTGYDAFAVHLTPGLRMTELRSVQWTNASGVEHTTAASGPSTSVFTTAALSQVQIWADPVTRNWGLAGDGIMTGSSEPFTDPVLRYGGTGRVDAPPNKTPGWWAAYGLLPGKATNIEVRTRNGAAVYKDIQSAPLTSIDATAVYIELFLHGPERQAGGVAEVTWSSPDGTRHTAQFPPTE